MKKVMKKISIVCICIVSFFICIQIMHHFSSQSKYFQDYYKTHSVEENTNELFIVQLYTFNEEEIDKIKKEFKVKDVMYEFSMIVLESTEKEVEKLKEDDNVVFVEANRSDIHLD